MSHLGASKEGGGNGGKTFNQRTEGRDRTLFPSSRSLFDQDYNLITCEPKRASHSLRVDSKRKKNKI